MPKRRDVKHQTKEKNPVARRSIPDWLAASAFCVTAFGIALFVHLRTPLFTEPDNFYHMGHASAYLENGLFYQKFPWAVFSVIGELGADIWWGFHVLLVPFAAIQDPLTGMKTAGVVLQTAFLLLLYFAMRLAPVPWPWLWPFLALFGSQVTLIRWMAVRPQEVSMPLFLMLVVLVCMRRSWIPIFLCSAAIGYFHQTLSWASVAVVGVATLVVAFVERRFEWRALLACIVGVGLAWMIRPAPFEALALLKIQILDLMHARQTDLPLAFGVEVYKLRITDLLSNFVPFLLLWLFAVIVMLWNVLLGKTRPDKTVTCLLWSNLLLSVASFQVTMVATMRALDPWLVFGAAFMAVSLGKFIIEPAVKVGGRTLRTVVVACSTGLLGALGINALYKTAEVIGKHGIDGTRMKGAMEWAKANTAKDSIIFHTDWSSFGEMFFWNRHNRFIGGMDPIFQYAFDPGTYWAVLRLDNVDGLDYEPPIKRARLVAAFHMDRMDNGRYTSKSPPWSDAQLVPTTQFLSKELGVEHVMLVAPISPKLYGYMNSERSFTKMYEDPKWGVLIYNLRTE